MAGSKKKYYPDVPSSPNFPEMEKRVLQSWEKDGTFKKSVESRDSRLETRNNEYVFYDGPPFANGLPHYGHLLTSCVKDIDARYRTMKGARVERRFGWDCHGLPAEMESEKELGVSGRKAIEEFGIDKFNEHCRTSVMKYTGIWQEYISRAGRWVDFENDYKTMDKDYMESVLWAFKQLYDKGLVYESYRVMPYSWAAQTPLSNFETRMDDAYREIESKAITVKFKLKEVPKVIRDQVPGVRDAYILAWTTTPWTLPSNLALAVKNDMEYVCIPASLRATIGSVAIQDKEKNLDRHVADAPRDDEYWILAQSEMGKLFPDFKDYRRPNVVRDEKGEPISTISDEEIEKNNKLAKILSNTFKGGKLLGLEYEPLFPYFKDQKNSFKILDGSDFIEEGSGTGVVHLAPGFGEDDQRVCEAAGIELVCPVDEAGRFTAEVFDIPLPLPLRERVGERGENTLSGLPQDNRGYDQDTLEFAKSLRGEQTETEKKLWAHLRAKRFAGYKFRRQQPIGNYIVDFVCQDEKLVIELDGSQHKEQKDYDERRSKFLESLGYQVIRFWNNDALKETETMLEMIYAALKKIPSPGANAPTSPSRGEGFLSLNGKHVFDTNVDIIKYLKSIGAWIKTEQYKHSYPHCWRTDTPLIYKAVPSWYVEVTKFKDRMVALNKNINWIPEHIRDGQFGKWLENARDWSISRNRFWGTPIPVWRTESGKIKVFGSIKEMEEFFGVKIKDLHRPFIDELIKKDGKDTWRRVTDVFDCWFESGAMPFAQVHYPFENKNWFETHFPADFIVEYVGQTRGWFYTLVVLATALFDKIPFKNCICHGIILDENGKKLSKRLRNYPDPNEMFDTYGADAMRWRMVKEPVMHGGNLLISKDGSDIRDVVRLSIKPIWNAYSFFTLYANADGIKASLVTRDSSLETRNVMDRYILAKLKQAVKQIDESLDKYLMPEACAAVDGFFEVLNNWYIRRNKERFWRSGEQTGYGLQVTGKENAETYNLKPETLDEDKQAAYDTLYTVLHVMCRAAAPLLPFTTEEIFTGLSEFRVQSSEKNSVHLQNFPDVSGIADEKELLELMDRARDVCNAALAIRNKSNIRVRQPLKALKLFGKDSLDLSSGYLRNLIIDEVNVKEFFATNIYEGVAGFSLKINFPVLGKRLPEKMKQIIPASKKGEWEQTKDGRVKICGEILEPEECSLALVPKNPKGAQALSTNDALVVLDLELSDELLQEGLARDLVRMIQEARKQADLHVSDKIELALEADENLKKAAEANADYIKEQTLANSLKFGPGDKYNHKIENKLDGKTVVINFSKTA